MKYVLLAAFAVLSTSAFAAGGTKMITCEAGTDKADKTATAEVLIGPGNPPARLKSTVLSGGPVDETLVLKTSRSSRTNNTVSYVSDPNSDSNDGEYTFTVSVFKADLAKNQASNVTVFVKAITPMKDEDGDVSAKFEGCSLATN